MHHEQYQNRDALIYIGFIYLMYAVSHALKKEDALIASINEMLLKGGDRDHLDEILLEAKKMQEIGSIYYAPAKRIMGMIAAMRGDVAETDSQFKAAIAHGGESYETLSAYAVALWNLRQIRRNLIILDGLIEKVQDNPDLIRSAIHNHLAAYDVDGVRKLLQLAEKLKLTEDELMQEIKIKMDETSNFLAESGVAWEQICERIELTANVLNKLGLYSPTMKTSFNDGVVFHEYILATDLDNVMKAEDAINEAVANMPFSPADQVLYFTCSQA